MKRQAKGWLTAGFVIDMIVSGLGIITFILLMVGVFAMPAILPQEYVDTNPDKMSFFVASETLLCLFGIILLSVMVIIQIIIYSLTLKSIHMCRKNIAFGILSILFTSLPVGGILYLCWNGK